MTDNSATEVLLRRDRWIVGGGLLAVCLLAWAWLLAGSGTGMSVAAMTSWQFPPPAMNGAGGGAWSAAYWLVMLLMWWIMMTAMMVPSAAPMILLYARVYQHGQERGAGLSPAVPTAAFAAGYLLAWLLFSAFATGLHFVLEQSGLVHRMTMWSTTAALSGAFLVVAGLYQFSPWKNRCLHQCRSPVSFLSTHWRKSRAGALRMGAEHGLYCVGCCWSLMLLLFVGGVMNLVWIAGLAAIVLLEKLHRFGHWVARAAGALMLGLGLYLLTPFASASAAPSAAAAPELARAFERVDGMLAGSSGFRTARGRKSDSGTQRAGRRVNRMAQELLRTVRGARLDPGTFPKPFQANEKRAEVRLLSSGCRRTSSLRRGYSARGKERKRYYVVTGSQMS